MNGKADVKVICHEGKVLIVKLINVFCICIIQRRQQCSPWKYKFYNLCANARFNSTVKPTDLRVRSLLWTFLRNLLVSSIRKLTSLADPRTVVVEDVRNGAAGEGNESEK